MKPKSDIILPFDPLIGNVTKPILDQETELKIEDVLQPLKKQKQWQAWEMHFLRPSTGAILLEGLPGTGKTTVARWLAKELKKGIVEVSMGLIGGGKPGDTERNLHAVFAMSKAKRNATIFIDECDGLLWNRNSVSQDSMFMLGVIGGLLQEIEKYPGLVILSTNLSHHLDEALARRVTRITLPLPPSETRAKLWSNKIPIMLYVPTNSELVTLSKYELTGAEIEKSIVAAALKALRLDVKKPTIAFFTEAAENAQTIAGRGTGKVSRKKTNQSHVVAFSLPSLNTGHSFSPSSQTC